MTLPDRPADVVTWNAHLPPEWLQELGRIAMFAAWVEETLHELYWHHAKLFVEDGVIVTGDRNPNRLTEDIIKLLALRPRQRRRHADLEKLFVEYRALAQKRNQCIHWIWSNVREGEAATIRPLYKGPGEYVVYTLDTLKILGDDLAWLRVRLSAHVDTDRHLRERRSALGERADFYAPAPWLDKQVRPDPKPSKTRATRKGRRRQPRSSQA